MAQAYSVSQAWAILRKGTDKEARSDIGKRFPLFATASAEEIISALELVGLRKMETWLRGEEETETPVPVARKVRPVAPVDEDEEEEDRPVRRGPGRPRKNIAPEPTPVKRGPGRPKKVVEPEPEEDEEEEEEYDEEEEEETPTPVKRGPGRPPKNNPLPTPSRKPAPVAKKRAKVEEEDEDFEDLDSFFDDEED